MTEPTIELAGLNERMRRAEADTAMNREDLNELTRNVKVLTRDVDVMVKSQQETVEMMRQQAVQQHELKTVSKALDRAFGRIETMEDDVQVIKTNQAVTEAKEGVIKLAHLVQEIIF